MSGFTSVFGDAVFTVVFSYRRTYMPASYHIAQELQKYNIPDYRPRQEQYVHGDQMLTLCVYVIFSVGSKRLLRKCVLCRGCDAIAGSLSVRPKTAPNKIRRGSSGLTTRPRALRNRRGIDHFTYVPTAFTRPLAFGCGFRASRVTY